METTFSSDIHVQYKGVNEKFMYTHKSYSAGNSRKAPDFIVVILP